MSVGRVIEEPVRVVRDLEEFERLKLGSAREEHTGSEIRMVPDVTRAALANLRFGQLPAVTGYDSKLDGFLGPGTAEWNEFFSTRKVVERPNAVGSGGVVSVASNLWDLSKVEEVVAQPLVGRQDPNRQRKYELVQVLTDPYLRDKFQLSEEIYKTLRVMAIADPDAAAARAQSCIRQVPGLEGCLVSAGKYSRSKSWARASVRHHATRFPVLSASSDAAVTGDKLLIYGPASRDRRWFVSGPVWYGGEVKDVYKMVCSAGGSSVMFALGSELTILDIDICDGYSFQSPSVEYHAGPQSELPRESALDATALMTIRGRAMIESSVDSLELVQVDGVDVASAVRITPKFVLVNDHVVREAGVLTVGGRLAEPVRVIGKDLWLVKCHAEVPTSWVFRDPAPGEAVVVCYRRGSRVQYTSPMTVRTTDGVTLVMSKSTSLVPGMSGGAVVALRDMAFLGVYEGVGSQFAMACAFTQEHFTDVCTAEHVSSMGHGEAENTEGTLYTRMKNRGLGKIVDVAIACMEPVFAGREHVGMGFQVEHAFRTPCNPAVVPLHVGGDRSSPVFEPVDQGLFEAHMAEDKDGPMLLRRPTFAEKVFVIGRDSEGPYYSSISSRVIHLGLSAKNFVIGAVDSPGALPLVGGLVVAESDGAVLGQYVRHHSSKVTGEGGFCVTLYDLVSDGRRVVERPEAALSQVFPMLHVSTWGAAVLEEIFSHPSRQSYDGDGLFNGGNLPLAYVGDSALKLAFGIKARELGIPYNEWQVNISKMQSNAAMVSFVERFGLDVYLRTGHGASVPKGSKAKADMLEAVAGAVYLSETFEVFMEFCEAGGFVPAGGGEDSDEGWSAPNSLWIAGRKVACGE